MKNQIIIKCVHAHQNTRQVRTRIYVPMHVAKISAVTISAMDMK